MHFIVQDICNQNACLIKVTLQWLKYSTVPNGVTLYTEKSKTLNQRTNGPVNAHLISWPSKPQNIHNLENIR